MDTGYRTDCSALRLGVNLFETDDDFLSPEPVASHRTINGRTTRSVRQMALKSWLIPSGGTVTVR
jgi:hypothetical protein